MSLKLLAIDLGKRSFHIHGIDSDGVIISHKTSRAKLIETIKELRPETIAMGPQHLALRLREPKV